MSEWREIDIPAAFYLPNEGKTTKVFRAAVKGPPMMVKEIPADEFPSDRASIVIEIEDAMKISYNELSGRDREENATTLIALHARDARYLCVSLIKALADGGDRVAEKLQEYAILSMDVLQAEEERDKWNPQD